MATQRPTTAMRPPAPDSAAHLVNHEEEEDEDTGMFSFLPPDPSSSQVPIDPATNVSPAAAYAAAFVHSHPEFAGQLNQRRSRAHSTRPEDDPFGNLSQPIAAEGYTVGSGKQYPRRHSLHQMSARKANTPVIEIAQEQLAQDGDSVHSSQAGTNYKVDHHGMPPDTGDSYVNVLRSHGYTDPALLEGADPYYLDKLRGLETFDGTDPLDLLEELAPEEEDSPFPEVRASVSNVDDPDMPCLTFRSWVLGIGLTAIGAALNLFFQLRYPSPFLSAIVIQIVSYPIGKFLASVLPMWYFKVPRFVQRWFGASPEWSLNPGPFNIKEHTAIIIMANAAVSPAYALNLTVVLDKFYDTPKGIGFDFLLVLSSQMFGYVFAGLCRRFLVWPAGMIWPSNLVLCTLLNTFHAEEDDGRDGSMTRYRFFAIVSIGAGLWYLLPGFLFVAVSWFSFICWIWPNHVVVNQLFGVSTGLGMSLLTFDWSQIAYIGSPLIVPWWAIANIFIGFVFFYWILTPAFYYTNFWFFAYMPIWSSDVYDRYGNSFNVSAVLGSDGQYDATLYQQYSPLYLPITYATIYAIAFTLSTAAIVHTALYHGPSIIRKLKIVRSEAEDIHAKLMRNYPEVPDWWYALYGVTFVALAIVAIEVWDTQLPVWGLLVALILAFVYILPGGFIFAMTSQEITINLLAELIPGFLFPGRPAAVMAFKSFAVQSLSSGLTFTQDLKFGHYMKIPPRACFAIQIVATIIASVVQILVKLWLETSVPDLCDADQKDKLTCPQASVFYSTSIIWGLIGPQRTFSPGHLYHSMPYWALIGAVLPIPFWLLSKRWPKSWFRYVNIPVLLTGASYIPPAAGINYSSWFVVGFIFQYVLRRMRFRWWSKFNFVLSAGLEGGTIIGGILIFLFLQLPDHGNITVNWWGNNVYMNTADYNMVPYKTPPTDGFGPTTWKG